MDPAQRPALPLLVPPPGEREWSFQETVLLRKSHRASALLIWGLAGFLVALVIWAVLAPLAETIAVQGKLEPGTGVRRIDAPVPGVVDVVLVKEGQLVRLGQPLIRFDLREARSRLAASEEVRDRLQQENRVYRASLGEGNADGLSGDQVQRLASQLQDNASRRESARQELARSQEREIGLQRSLATSEAIASRYERLAASGAVSEVQALESRDRANDLRTQLAAERRDIARLQANLITTGSSVGVDLRGRIETNLKQLSELEREIKQARLQLAYSELNSPSEGVVFDIKVGKGSVVQASNTEPLLKIVPQAALRARVYLPNAAVGFVRPGQQADLALDAFDASDFGRIPARVERVGSDALTPDELVEVLGNQAQGLYFPAILALDRQSLDRLQRQPLRAGMSLTADIKVRERRFINLITGFFEDKQRNLERLR